MPTRSFKEIMNPPGRARITQMSDFLKVFCSWRSPGEDLPRHRGANRMGAHSDGYDANYFVGAREAGLWPTRGAQ
jgi:hypothetical protein